MDLIKRFGEYINNIKKEDKIAILYHANCCDGLCSCIITNKALERILKRKVDFNIHYTHFEITEEIIEFFKKNKIKKVIAVDLSLYAKSDMIKKAENYVDLLIIDHHEHKGNINSRKTTFVHADLINEEIKSNFYPASKLCYDLFSSLIDLTDLDWLVSLGIISDMGYRQWREFVNSVMNKYDARTEEDVFKTEFGTATVNISSAKKLSDNVGKVFDIVYKAKNYKDILENKYLVESKEKINEEMKYWLHKSNEAEKHGNLIIYEIKPKLEIGSSLSTILSIDKYKEKTVIVLCDYKKNYIKINARSQTEVRVNDLLQKATSGLKESKAGGHAQASGGKIRKEDLQIFKERLIREYEGLTIEALTKRKH